MILKPLVALYRAAHRPALADDAFEARIVLDSETRAAIIDIWHKDRDLIDRISIDGADCVSENDIPDVGQNIEFVVRIPKRNANKFYESAARFTEQTAALSQGEFPEELYLIEEDWYSEEMENEPVGIEKIKAICELIIGLAQFAHYHDQRNSGKARRLVYIQPNQGSNASPIAFDTTVSAEMLSYQKIDLRIFKELNNASLETDSHYQAKVDVLTASLGEFLRAKGLPSAAFDCLIRCWGEFSELYTKNYQTYISGFAFHKAKREVAEEIFKLSERFSKLTNDIAGKLLVVPVSIAAIMAVDKATPPVEKGLLFAALCTTSIIVAAAVYSQQRELKRIAQARDIVVNALNGRKDEFPDDLRKEVDNLEKRGKYDEWGLRYMLWIYQVFAWFPAIAGAIVWYF